MTLPPSDVSMSSPEMGEKYNTGAPPAKRSTWPTVLGVLGIIFGSLGVLMNLCGFFVGIFIKSMLASLSGDMSPEEMARITTVIPDGMYVVIGSVIGVVLAVLLLVGSISLLKRRASCRMMLNSYVVLGLLWLVSSFTWNVAVVYPEMMEKQAKQNQQSAETEVSNDTSLDTDPTAPTPAASPLYSDSSTGSGLHPAVSEGCGAVFSIAWFVVLAIFMNGNRYRTEIESWRD